MGVRVADANSELGWGGGVCRRPLRQVKLMRESDRQQIAAVVMVISISVNLNNVIMLK